jgi:short subunit fatty acids transporter
MLNRIYHELIPTTTDLMHWTNFILLMTVVVLGLLAVAKGVKNALDRIRKALDEQTPVVDDVTERRRVKAEAFAQRRAQLDAATGRRS